MNLNEGGEGGWWYWGLEYLTAVNAKRALLGATVTKRIGSMVYLKDNKKALSNSILSLISRFVTHFWFCHSFLVLSLISRFKGIGVDYRVG